MSELRKAIAGLSIPLIAAVALILDSSSSSITSHEWLALATAVLTGLGVYVVPNTPAS